MDGPSRVHSSPQLQMRLWGRTDTLVTGSWHFSETWQQIYIQWRKTYNSHSRKAESSPCLSCRTLWYPSSRRCEWSKSSSMQALDGSHSVLGQSLRKVLTPIICGLGFSIQRSGRRVTVKIWSQVHSTEQSRRESGKAADSLKLLLSDGLLSSRKKLAVRLH